jgi:hypothetical protein
MTLFAYGFARTKEWDAVWSKTCVHHTDAERAAVGCPVCLMQERDRLTHEVAALKDLRDTHDKQAQREQRRANDAEFNLSVCERSRESWKTTAHQSLEREAKPADENAKLKLAAIEYAKTAEVATARIAELERDVDTMADEVRAWKDHAMQAGSQMKDMEERNAAMAAGLLDASNVFSFAGCSHFAKRMMEASGPLPPPVLTTKSWMNLTGQMEAMKPWFLHFMSKLKARAPEVVTPGKTKALFYGPAGVGKTWFALSFPTPYYIGSEPGADKTHYQERLKAAGGRYFGPEDGALDFAAVCAEVVTLTSETHPYRTLVIDSVTKLYQTAIALEQERLGDKDAFGASKKPAVAGMRRLIALTSRLDMNVLFIAHETGLYELSAKTGQREEVGKTADTWDKLMYELDLAIQVQRRGAKRVGMVKKTRLLGFPEGDTFDLEYAEFAKRYGRDFIEAAHKPLELSTPEQAAEITRLLEILKMPEGEFEKWLTKAGASSISEMSREHAAKSIEALKKKIS